jgi:hypothetical protein
VSLITALDIVPKRTGYVLIVVLVRVCGGGCSISRTQTRRGCWVTSFGTVCSWLAIRFDSFAICLKLWLGISV